RVVDSRNIFPKPRKTTQQMSYRHVHTLLEKMQTIFPSYSQFPQDRKNNYVLIAIEMFPAACRYEDFATDENGRFVPRNTLTNICIETTRDDSSLVTWNHRGKKIEVSFHFWHQMRHIKERNTMYPLLTCD
ncbi:hypothetical protein PENTCL1PPCAC_27929, partial [Pristionchus entomophagus]